jgi:hypothetical protein
MTHDADQAGDGLGIGNRCAAEFHDYAHAQPPRWRRVATTTRKHEERRDLTS